MKRFIATILAVMMLITMMPTFVFAENTIEPTAIPVVTVEPTAESTEEPVVESTEKPTAESTEVPAEEPEEESTEVPAEEPEAEATGVPAEEPEAEATEMTAEEPEAEATEMPAEEPEAEATEMPAEEETDVPDGEITEEAIALASTEEISCAHEHTYSEEVALKGSDYNGKYGEYNEDNGTFDGVYYNEKYDVNGIRISKVIIYCSDCKEKLKEELKYDRSDSWLFFHNFDEDNGCKCRNCGFVCPHTETYEFEVSEDYDLDYVAVNEKEHQYTVTYIEVETVCEVCGKWISSEKINKTETVVEKHSCYNGVCWDCGYVYDSCKHENVLRAGAYDGEWISIDENYHMNDMTFNWSDIYDYCRDCGCSLKDGKVVKNLGDDEAGEDRCWTDFGAEPHVFENGVCKLCGYQKQEEVTCDHSAGNFRDELDTSVAPKYSNIYEDTHCVQYSYKRYCKDCGEYITNVVDEGITPVAHDFSNGDTCVCGYTKRVYTISFSNISNGDTATAGKDLNVSWTQVEGIDHYEFAARYTDENEQCVARKSVGLNTTAAVPSVKYNKTLQLWVGVFANSGDKEPVCSATIQLKTTVCDHCADPDGWTFVRFEKRYVNVDGTGHVLQEITLFDIDCSICGAKLRDYEGMVYSFDKEAHNKQTTAYGKEVTSYTSADNEYHTVHKEQTVTYTCACGYSWKETIKLSGDGAKEQHKIGSDGKCSVCGYGDYEQEVERIRKLIESVYSDLCAGKNCLSKEYPNGFGGYGGTYICGTFVGLQARYLGFDYLGCNGKPFSGQPNGRDWCNYSRDASHDWASSSAGLGKDMEIVNTVDGKRYVQRIYLEKDADECCLKDLLAANDYQNLYNVIISYSQKGNTSSDGHVRYIYAILKDPSSSKWMVYFSDNMTSKNGVKEGKMVSAELDEFITWSRKYYYINGVIHFEPQK